ncbi:MAG: phosphatidate cytidylyltransferase [Neisseriaceae bacterium]|nr:phosphatidate cytidylyltransferase [Neisseriaceae bacterium]
MLATRLKTGVVLFLIMGSALFYLPPSLWAIFSAVMVSIAVCEFSNMAKLTLLLKVGLMSLILAIEAIIYLNGSMSSQYLGHFYFYEGIGILCFWLLVVPFWLRYKWTAYMRYPILAYLLALILFLPTWQGLVFFVNEKKDTFLLLTILGIAWVADIAAYFTGKTWGKYHKNLKKLAPTISPGKSWAGACGAVIAVCFYSHIVFIELPLNLIQMIGFSILMTAVSIMGDLLESWFKRAANLKDSGFILPGHGGMYDRIDSMVAVIPVFFALTLCL